MLPAVAFEILRDNPDILLLDLRSREEYLGELGHISGATNIPLDELEQRFGGLSLHGRAAYLLYCRQGDDCGVDGAELLLERGLRSAFLIEGGLEGWLSAGFGTVRSVPDESG